MGKGKGGDQCNSTLHVFFSLVDDKCISSVLVIGFVAHNADLLVVNTPL
jgi:hypothetical protein